jgi:hypothetical protein
MNAASAKTESQKQVSILHMARLRVEIAESRWEETKEQAREARRKRKEMKVIARRAKKEAKQAKAELAEARSFLADTEAKLATPAAPAAKARKSRPGTSASPTGSDTVAHATPPAPDSENEASTALPQVAAMVEKPPEAAPRGSFGNWQ